MALSVAELERALAKNKANLENSQDMLTRLQQTLQNNLNEAEKARAAAAAAEEGSPEQIASLKLAESQQANADYLTNNQLAKAQSDVATFQSIVEAGEQLLADAKEAEATKASAATAMQDQSGLPTASVSDTQEVLSDSENANIKSSDVPQPEGGVSDVVSVANADDSSSASASPASKLILNQTKTFTSEQTVTTPKPQMNPLHSYATYTYGVTLYVLSKESYNKLITNSADESWITTGAYSLISSASGHHENRHPEFREDFYFDGLTAKTIIGMNSQTRASNAIEFSFNIIEPYGITLLDRLMEVCDDKRIGGGNYVNQPYMLEVNFFGSTELGKPEVPIPNLKKRFPIKIIEIKIKVGAKGTEYICRAVPWSHQAFNETNSTTPVNFEIKASTVGEFFDANVHDNLAQQIKTKDDQRQSFESITAQINEAEMSGAMDRVNELSKQYLELKKSIATPYSASSYAGAWNAWHQKVVDHRHVKFANRVKFVIDDEIKNSPIVDPTKLSYSRSNMSLVNNKSAAQDKNAAVSSKTPANGFDPNTMIFNISSGTNVVDVINLVLRNSDYIKSQVVDPLTDKADFKKDAKVDYFKIIPKITLLDFDPLRNEFSREITYYIKKYSYVNTKHPNLPYGKVDGAVKEYNYIYTGKNIDILDLQIDFDTAYYTSKIVNRNTAEATSGAILASDGNETAPDTAQKAPGAGTVAPVTVVPINGDGSAQSTGADTAKTVLVANAMKSIYSSSRGDMLNVKMKILGDPHFIKQDDIYVTPDDPAATNATMINNGTLNLDRGEIFCTLNFRSPTDMDDATGLAKFNPKYKESKFSGYYRVLVVDNEFKGGQFVQTLDLVRIFDNVPTVANAAPTSTLTTSNDTNRAQTTNTKIAQDIQDTAARSSSAVAYSDTTIDPTAADSTQTVASVTSAVDVADSLPTASPSVTDDVLEPEVAQAAQEGQSIADNLGDAPVTDITAQSLSDLSSPVPQNPPVTVQAKQSQDEAAVQAEITKAQSDVKNAERRLNNVKADPTLGSVETMQARYDAAVAALNAAYEKAKALSAANA